MSNHQPERFVSHQCPSLASRACVGCGMWDAEGATLVTRLPGPFSTRQARGRGGQTAAGARLPPLNTAIFRGRSQTKCR